SDGLNPSCLPIAYATALSKPFPFAGLLSWKYGGYAGESVATVSTPGLWSARCALAQALAEAVVDGLLAVVELPHPLTTSTAAATIPGTKIRNSRGNERNVYRREVGAAAVGRPKPAQPAPPPPPTPREPR